MPTKKKTKKENSFQADLVEEIRERFPEVEIEKNDPTYLQGFPDLALFMPNGKWALLECKRSPEESYQPNQEYYLNKMDSLGFAKRIDPSNKEEVLDALERSFKT